MVTNEKIKIELNPEMISGDGNPKVLADKQDGFWQPSLDDREYPKWAYIDLGDVYQLTDIRLFDVEGKGMLRIYAGGPEAWTFQAEYETSAYNEWQYFKLTQKAQHIAIQMLEADAKVSVVEIWGFPVPVDENGTKKVDMIISDNGQETVIQVDEDVQVRFVVKEVVDEDAGQDPHVNKDPIARFAHSSKPSDHKTIYFDGQDSSDSDGRIVKYSWDFGDGKTGVGKTISHTYDTEGTYAATLTVKDELGGTGSYTSEIIISEVIIVDPGPGPGPDTGGGDPSELTVGQIMSACTLPDDPLNITLEAVTRPNPYVLSKWFAYDVQSVDTGKLSNPHNVEYAYDPSDGGGSWQNNYFKACAEAGAHCIPRFKESFMYLTNNSKPDLDNKPRFLSENGNDPKSWRHISNYFYQFAARYGRTEVADSLLQLRKGQQRLSGLGWIRAMQLENEADKWWLGKDSEFTPEEWAAYHSACYDGHMNTMGERYGIKNADPKMKVISGPLAHLDFNYLDRAVAWWKANRKDPNYPVIPVDSFSFHRYANTSGPEQRNLSGKGMAPEPFGFFDYTREFVEWVEKLEQETGRKYGKEITEFGYDTNSSSPQGIIPFHPYNTEDIQAMWMVRSYLSHIAAGCDRVAMYMLRDAGAGGGIFVTSGLTTGKGEWRKKAAHKALAVMLEAIGDYNFDSIVTMTNDVWVLKFTNGNQAAYSIHTPADQKKSSNYLLKTDSLKVDIIDWDGSQMTKDVANGKIEIMATERPKFVIARRIMTL